MADTIERVYKITADANQAIRELNKLNKSVGNIDNTLKKTAGILKGAFASAAVLGAINAVTSAIGNSISAMDELGKTTQKLGVSAQDLVGLQLAAEMTDISANTLSTSITKLNKAIAESASGQTSKGAEALAKLGVDVKDSAGNLRNSAAVFSDVAQAFSQIPDGAQKAAVAMQLFGKSGAELIPLLNEGADGLNKFNEEAKRFGLVVTDADTALADQFNDNLDNLGKMLKGRITQFGVGLLPALQAISKELQEGAVDVDTWRIAGEKLGKVLLIIKNTYDLLTKSQEQQGDFFIRLGEITRQAFSMSRFTMAADQEKIKKSWDDALAEVQKDSDDIDAQWQKLLDSVMTDSAKQAEAARKQFEKEFGDKPVEAKIKPVFDSSALDVNQLSEDFNKAFDAAKIETTLQVTNDVNDSLGVYSSQLETAAQMNLALAESMKETEEQSDVLSVAIGQTLASSVDSFIDQIVAGEFTFKKFVSTMIVEIAKLIAKLQILRAIESAFPGLTANAKGSAFSSLGMKPGVYTTPQFFPMAGTGTQYFARGGVGVMAEAGPEAILPLRRGRDGKLGVESSGAGAGNINIHNYSNSQVTARRVDDDIEIIVNRVAADILRGGSKISRAMEGTYSVNRVRAAL